MANTTSAAKAIKQIKKRTAINRIRLGKYKSAVKTIEEAIVSKDKNKALKLFANFQSQVMKASKTGSLKRKTVSRKVSRIAKKISKL
ncbi:MAG: 30S ribosomal protein S20 [Candidatus Fonsibacter sp.]